MTYPIKIGIREQLERFKERGLHEFIVVTGDEHASAIHTQGFDPWDARIPMLGYIDLTTGRKCNIASKLSWWETAENVNSKLYTKYFEPRTVYRVKGYVYELKEGETYDKWNAGIVVSEITMAGEYNAYLAQVCAEWDRPIMMQSELFGQLLYNKKYTFYSGKFNWLGTQVTMKIDDEEDNAAESLEYAEKLCKNCVEWDKRFKESIAEELTYLANDWLRDADKPEITEEEFVTRITMELIDISSYNDGTFYIWYDDDGIFAGHSVTVYGTFKEGITHVQMEG